MTAVNLDGDDDSITRFEVVYVPTSVADQFLTSASPDAVLQANVTCDSFEIAPMKVSKSIPPPFPKPTFYVVVASELCVRVEESAMDVEHGDQVSQPMVLDATGAKAFKPSYKAAAVQSTTDWLDAPPKGSASVGVWSFQKHFLAPYGIDAGLQLRVSSGQDPALAANDATLTIAFGLPYEWTYDASAAAWCNVETVFDPTTASDLSTYRAKIAAMGAITSVNVVQNGFSLATRYFVNGAFFFFVVLKAVSFTPPAGQAAGHAAAKVTP